MNKPKIEALEKAKKSIYDRRRYAISIYAHYDFVEGLYDGLQNAELILHRHIAKLKGK